MANRRKVEVFSAGCGVREETVSRVRRIASNSCEVVVLDMQDDQAAERAKNWTGANSRQTGMRGRLLLAILLGILLRAAPAEAAFLSAELTVNGLSCPFCAFGIEKKLLDVHGVRDAEVFLDEGRIVLTFQPDSEATVDELEKAVEKAGFELAAVSLEVSGELLEEGSVRLIAHPGEKPPPCPRTRPHPAARPEQRSARRNVHPAD